MPARSTSPSAPVPSRRRTVGLAALAVTAVTALLSTALLAWSAIGTASGRISGTTRSQSLLSAAVVDLDLDLAAGGGGVASDLFLDGGGVVPGEALQRCVQINYRGSAGAASVRLHARRVDGTGLERFVATTVAIGSGTRADCSDFADGTEQIGFTGTLEDFAIRHGSFADGVPIMSPTGDEASATVRFAVEIESDNAAQGLSTAYYVTVEVRP